MELDRQGLVDLARQLVKDNGGQVAVATALGVSQPTISLALNVDRDSGAMDLVLMRIVSELGGRDVAKRVVFDVE